MTVGTAQNPDMDLAITVFVTSKSEVCVFHDKPFSKPVSWLEYNPDTNIIEFMTDDGEVRNFGIPLPEKYRAAVAASKIVYVIHKNPLTKKVLGGKDVPLVIQGLPYH